MVAVMDHGMSDGEERFGAYGEALAEVIGHDPRWSGGLNLDRPLQSPSTSGDAGAAKILE